MTPATVNDSILTPMFAGLLPGFDSAAARVLLLAIGLQESRFEHRRQIGGPARGLWQFERGGGVHGVLNHGSSSHYAAAVCAERGVEPLARDVYEALERDDQLAAAFARLLLWTDPKPLPPIGDAEEAWQCYVRNWRPGKPHRKTWDSLYAQAVEAIA